MNLDPSGMFSREKYVKTHHHNLYLDILEFGDKYKLILPFKELVYHFNNNITDRILCKTCGKYTNYINSTLGYHEYCSPACISKNKNIKQIKKEKSLAKYNTKTPAESVEVKIKMKNTINNKSDLVKEKIKNSKLDTFSSNYIFRKLKSDNLMLNIDCNNKIFTLKCDCNQNHIFTINSYLYHQRKRKNFTICTICKPIKSLLFSIIS
jgi:hypothetical protein